MIYLILAPIFFAVALSFFKIPTTTMHPLLGNVFTSAVALFVTLLILFYSRFKGVELFYTRGSILLSIAGGVFIGLYTVSLFFAFSKFDISKTTPIVYIGAISISVIIGTIFLKENINWLKILGLIIAFLGLLLLFKK